MSEHVNNPPDEAGTSDPSMGAATGTQSSSTTTAPVASTNGAARSSTVTMTETETETEEETEILELTLRPRPTVRWDESVVDNEGMGRKSSKRCCIFHKQRDFGESSTDSSDYDSDRSGSSTASGADGDHDDGEKKMRPRRKGRIARPKKNNKVPDYQRFHS